jgi:hypothetical protein
MAQHTDSSEQVVTIDRGNTAMFKSEPALSPAREGENEFLEKVSNDILDKQYRLYVWNDTKAVALITANSVLFAAMGFLYKECLRETLAFLFLSGAMLLIGTSLAISLVHVIPRLTSGQTGREPNIRSLRGMKLFENWRDYYEAFSIIRRDDVLKDTVRQIYGMGKNNRRSILIIKTGVIITLLGMCAMISAAFVSGAAIRGYKVYGPWEPASVVAPQLKTTAPVSRQPSRKNTPANRPSNR